MLTSILLTLRLHGLVIICKVLILKTSYTEMKKKKNTFLDLDVLSHGNCPSSAKWGGLAAPSLHTIHTDDTLFTGRQAVQVPWGRGWGISLEGTVDVENRVEVRPHYYRHSILMMLCLQVAQLSKFREGGGLGISLEGTVDVENRVEVRPPHYIRSMAPPLYTDDALFTGSSAVQVPWGGRVGYQSRGDRGHGEQGGGAAPSLHTIHGPTTIYWWCFVYR